MCCYFISLNSTDVILFEILSVLIAIHHFIVVVVPLGSTCQWAIFDF